VPGTDARTGVSNPRTTAELDTPGGELVHEEGLATALSAFLSQMHFVAGTTPAPYAPDPGPAAVQALRANRLSALSDRGEVPTALGTNPGGLARRYPDDPSIVEEEGPADRKPGVTLGPTPGKRPSAPLLPASRSGTVAQVPRSDAWATPEPPAPVPKAERPAAARAAAIAQGGQVSTPRTVRARPVPEIRVDDLREPWLGTEDHNEAVWLRPQAPKASDRAQPPRVAHELLLSHLEAPTVLNDPTVVNEATAAHETRAPDEPTVAGGPTDVAEATVVNEPPEARKPNVLDQPRAVHEQLFLLARPDGQVIASTPEASRQRKAAVAGVALAIFAATTLGVSVYWGYRTNATLNQRNLELATTQASLGAVQDSLTAAQSTLLHQHQSYVDLKAGIKQVAEQYVATKTQLEQVQIALGRTQGQLTQAQSQVGRAQDQLGNTQQNLSTTQSHAVQIQRGAVLLQQTAQLLTSLIVLENDYITAAQTHNGSAMKSDLAEMRALEDQAQTLEPKPSPPAR
jgi:hypothetical protein